MIKLIVAKGLNNAIGKNNSLIWKLPRDMKFFTETTRGNVVLMGRKNWDSIPSKFRPLPERVNAVVTRNEDFNDPDCLIFPSIEIALEYFDNKEDRDVFIIGGGEIYSYCLQLGIVGEMFITEVKESFEADI
ncbi:dihydrofolate reductase, partial [Crocinitomix catalasitica]|nr:dihydrofolate reductase [Crocinitomix catalasitica]